MKVTKLGFLYGVVYVLFVVFNYMVTEFALHDMLGELGIWGMRWSQILAFSFCFIDATWISMAVTGSPRVQNALEYILKSAWFLGAGFNAMVIWWAVALKTDLIGLQLWIPIIVFAVRYLLMEVFLTATDKLLLRVR